jgi:hypothetical protein
VTPTEPSPEKPFEVKWWWVVLTAGTLWLIGAVSLIVYLLQRKPEP